MGLGDRSTPARSVASGDLLDSWKEIARHLNRDIRTVQRWEHDRDLPVHRLPGGSKPGVYALRSELEDWWKKTRINLVSPDDATAPRSLAPSVAVLPFANLSAEKENQYFSDGLADEIINALTRIRGLLVTARTSSFAFRGKERDVRQIGAALSVGALLEGSVQRSGDRIRVSAQLVSTTDGFHLWSERFDGNAADVFEIQDEISSAIASALKVRLMPGPPARRTVSLDAYHLWLKGRFHQQNHLNLESLAQSREYFEQAISLDPLFPLPYLGLAELNRGLAYYGVVCSREAGAQAWTAIQQALRLDDSLGEAYALSGTYRAWIDFDWKGAEADFARSALLNPAAIEAHWLYAMMCLLPLNRMEEAVREMERTIELDPLSPLMHTDFAWLLAFQRDYDRAMEEIETALALDPDFGPGFAIRGSIHYHAGRVEEGLASWQSAAEIWGRAAVAVGALGYGLALLGRRPEAEAALAELEAASRTCYVSPINRAWILVGLGEFDAAFTWLDRAVEDRDPHVGHLPTKPLYDPIRQDPRFHALLKKMSLQ